MNFLQLFQRNGLIAAHRGARSIAPENTLTALKKSVGHCDFIEFDVQLSADGIGVIMHDDTLERTTNITDIDIFKDRTPYRVSDFSFNELCMLDYGSWFNGVYEPLLSLEGALHFIKENQLFVNVEIKDMHERFSDEQVVTTVIAAIEKLHVKENVLLSSYRHEYLKRSKALCPGLPTAALVEYAHPENLLDYLKEYHVNSYHLDDELVDAKTIRELRDAGIFVNVYTVNNKKRAQALFKMGVNGVFTDVLD